MEIIYRLLFYGFIIFIFGYLINFYVKPIRERWNEHLETEKEEMRSEQTEMKREIERLSARVDELERKK
ncbi:hypothetical protein ACERII_13195 [Evansella sp. AB-rgal1]|uniref:hypothetical protein n=1 Tax=Evansella sp. AB-rgal1 TaxID=3242696 RepID=UPI00359D519C